MPAQPGYPVRFEVTLMNRHGVNLQKVRAALTRATQEVRQAMPDHHTYHEQVIRAVAEVLLNPHGQAHRVMAAGEDGNPYPGRVWLAKAGRFIRVLYRIEADGVEFVRIGLRKDVYKVGGKKACSTN